MAAEKDVFGGNGTISQRKVHHGDKVKSYSLTAALLVLAIGKSVSYTSPRENKKIWINNFFFFQVSNYSINYFNGGKYPLPQTLLVILFV